MRDNALKRPLLTTMSKDRPLPPQASLIEQYAFIEALCAQTREERYHTARLFGFGVGAFVFTLGLMISTVSALPIWAGMLTGVLLGTALGWRLGFLGTYRYYQKQDERLYEAVLSNDKNGILASLKGGADVTYEQQPGKTLLHYALFSVAFKAARLLWDRGIQIRYTQRWRSGSTYRSDIMILMRMNMTRGDYKKFIHYEGTADYHTLNQTYPPLLAALLARDLLGGIHQRHAEHSGWSYSYEQCVRTDESFPLFLIEQGADVTQPFRSLNGSFERPLLSVALYTRFPRVVRKLVELGADVNEASFLRTVVHKKLEPGEYLSTDTRIFGETPLHIAALWGDLALTKFLLEQGARLNARANVYEKYYGKREPVGAPPLFWAVARKRWEVSNYLLSIGAEVNLHPAPPWYRAQVNSQYLSDGLTDPGPYSFTRDVRSILHLATEIGDLEFAEVLKKAGADLTVRTNRDWLPFQWAYKLRDSGSDYLTIAKLLAVPGEPMDLQAVLDAKIRANQWSYYGHYFFPKARDMPAPSLEINDRQIIETYVKNNNPYELLCLAQSSSEAEINASYKKLARKYHPDRNRGDLAKSERFALISSAHEYLTDPAKRAYVDACLEEKTSASFTY